MTACVSATNTPLERCSFCYAEPPKPGEKCDNFGCPYRQQEQLTPVSERKTIPEKESIEVYNARMRSRSMEAKNKVALGQMTREQAAEWLGEQPSDKNAHAVAWMVIASTKDDQTESVWVSRSDAEQDAYEWRINGRETRIIPLFQHESATKTIRGMDFIRTLKKQRDEIADALRLFVKAEDEWQRTKSGMPKGTFDDPLSDAYRAAVKALEGVPTYEQQLRNIAEGIGMSYEELLAAASALPDRGEKK